MLSNIHFTVIRRLFIVSVLLVAVLGGGVYYLEMLRVDDTVLALAVDSAKAMDAEQLRKSAHGDLAATSQLQQFGDSLVQQHFYAVDIYDLNRAHIVTSEKHERADLSALLASRHHQFPLDKNLYHEKFLFDNQLYMQVLIPLPRADDSALGYMEGVYRVDEQTLAAINARIRYVLTLVALIVVATTIALYPVILWLNRRLSRFSGELLQANLELLQVLGNAIASRDSGTNSHNYRVALYSVKLAEKIGMSRSSIRNLLVGAFLHDVGKIGVSDVILRKPGPLSHDELHEMREHVNKGLAIINHSQWLQGAKDVIACHHEKYDGTGYGKGLRGEQIPLAARVFAIVDVFDALTSRRSYKEPFALAEVINIMAQESARHFDPALLNGFLSIAKTVFDDYAKLNDAALERHLSIAVYKYFFNESAVFTFEPTSKHAVDLEKDDVTGLRLNRSY